MWLILAYVLSLVTQHHYDMHVFYLALLKFLKDGNPYVVNPSDPWVYLNPFPYVQWYAYPPLMLYIWSLPALILNAVGLFNEFTFRVIVKTINLVALISLYKVISKYSKNSKKLILMNPLILFVSLIHGMQDVIVAFFLVLALHYLRQGKRWHAWTSVGLALLTKQNAWPIFPLMLLYTKDRIALISILIFLVGLLPFLITSPMSILFNMLRIHLSRPPTSLGYSGIPMLFVAGDASSLVLANVIGPCLSKAIPSMGVGGYILTLILIVLYVYSLILAYKGEFKKALLLTFVSIMMFSKVLSPQNLIPYISLIVFYDLMPTWSIIGISISAALVDMFLGTNYSIIGYLAEDVLNAIGTSITILTREVVSIFANNALLYLRIPGLLGIVLYNASLLSFIYMKLRGYRKAILILMYLVYIALVMNAVSIELKSANVGGEGRHATLWIWSNPRPGFKGGDYILLKHLPRDFPYWDFTYPVLLDIAKWVKEQGYGTVWLVFTEDKSMLYLYEVTLLALSEYGLRYAWLIIIPRSVNDYLAGWASMPSPSDLQRVINEALRLTPVWINQKLKMMKDKLEINITWRCPLGYVTENGKPVIYIYDPIGKVDLKHVKCDCVIKVVKEYGELNPLDDYYTGRYILPLSVFPPKPRWLG